MEIIVLGTGCAKCNQLENTVREAVEKMEISADIKKEKDIQKIMQYNVLATPALVIDGKVVLSGKVPALEELMGLISNC